MLLTTLSKIKKPNKNNPRTNPAPIKKVLIATEPNPSNPLLKFTVEIKIKTFLIGAGLVLGLFLFGFFILLRIVKSIARSQELLFLFSICWAFLASALFALFGFSLEIGALIAGMILSVSHYSTEISSKIKPLRDFFLIIFFIILGLNLDVSNVGIVVADALILSVIVLFFKPIILMFFMALFKYTKRTSFLVSTSLAQISEFSLIILIL